MSGYSPCLDDLEEEKWTFAIYVAAARNGSFSAAGHELNVRQPIISKRIRELEDELGVFLFDRSTAGARLTPSGEEFVVAARRIIDAFQRLSERAKASGAGKTGEPHRVCRRPPTREK
ncbi:DNA-binding transcriptional LysR family regulator [Rhizobium petrolearium]|uniref:LysR family transcriptional regulator n=1 Tax=Neorhizobium petrolearium TaxID=515361 RepID=UPI001FDD14EA|nr:LysR family transcriptional regulator [Neorhizobium petrolearium]MBP1848144.1 DNA-binding transcriptional LysR family regulator [Neorhizobium petrolearium]